MSDFTTMDEARALIAALRAELVEAEAKLAIARMAADHSRAVMAEEAKRCVAEWVDDVSARHIGTALDLLAGSDPALMVVSVAEWKALKTHPLFNVTFDPKVSMTCAGCEQPLEIDSFGRITHQCAKPE